jgi:group I intron endonuclease
MANRVSGVYRIRNVVSGSFYIGSSEDVYRRFEAHRRQLRAGAHKNRGLQQSWENHGEDVFKFEILEKVEPERLREVEKRYLVPLLSHPKCTNMHDETYTYPRTGTKHSEETKAKISAKVQAAVSEGRGGKFIPSAETRAKMSESLLGNRNAKGHERTEEHRRKLSEANKGNQNFLGRSHTEESRFKMGRAIVAVSPEGVEHAYATITQLREDMGMTAPTVHRALDSQTHLTKGRHAGWRFYYAESGRPSAQEVPQEYADMPRTRTEAKRIGAKKYFTGDPCTHGHVAPRYTKGQCVVCAAEEQRARASTNARG